MIKDIVNITNNINLLDIIYIGRLFYLFMGENKFLLRLCEIFIKRDCILVYKMYIKNLKE